MATTLGVYCRSTSSKHKFRSYLIAMSSNTQVLCLVYLIFWIVQHNTPKNVAQCLLSSRTSNSGLNMQYWWVLSWHVKSLVATVAGRQRRCTWQLFAGQTHHSKINIINSAHQATGIWLWKYYVCHMHTDLIQKCVNVGVCIYMCVCSHYNSSDLYQLA